MIDLSDFFVAGGTLRAQSLSYVTRPADSDLLNHLLAGEFCYVLTARQMGKSSLMVRTAQRLQEQGVQTAIIDLTSIGTVAQEAWYLGLLSRLRSGLRLSEVDVQVWWQAHAQLSAAQRFTLFLRDVVLAAIQSQVVIFIDEIDATLGLTFRDDFFAALRAIYNARANEPIYNRLTFALFGVATPTDLIQDRERTPFNIGHRIDLREFTYTDAEPLRIGLDASHPGQGEPILQRIFFWTNGHPYLTQKLCAVIAGQSTDAWDNSDVDQVVEKNFLSDEGRKDTNLTFVQDRIAASPEPERRAMLTLYRQVHQGKFIRDDDRSSVQNRLELYGLLRVGEKRLQVRNELYRRVFNADWIKANMPVNTQRQRAILAVGAMLVLVIGVIAYILNQPNPTCDAYTKQFNETKASALRIDALAGLFNANCRQEALTLFYALSPYDQEELFLDAKNIQVNSLITTIKGIYVTLDTMPEPERHDLKLMSAMLEAMKEAGVTDNDSLVMQISNWYKGREQARSKRYQDAVDSYGVALALYPDHPVIHFDRAKAYINLTRYDSALKDLDDVIRVAQMTQPTPVSSPLLTPSLTSSSSLITLLSTPKSTILAQTLTNTLTSAESTSDHISISYSHKFFDSDRIIATVKDIIQEHPELFTYWQVNTVLYKRLGNLEFKPSNPSIDLGLQLAVVIDPSNVLAPGPSGQTHHAEVSSAILDLIENKVIVRNVDLLAAYSIKEDSTLQTIQGWTHEPNLIFNSTVQNRPDEVSKSTLLTDLLLQVLDKFQTQAQSLPLVRSLLLFSAGTSPFDLAKVVAKANELNVHIYTVKMVNLEQLSTYESTLSQLAQQTQGSSLSMPLTDLETMRHLLTALSTENSRPSH